VATLNQAEQAVHFDGLPGRADRLGRALRDLRISVTDRCNFRCPYCMPKEVFGRDFEFLPHDEVLSYEEIRRLATVFVSLGVRKLRITGGEPLVRRNLPELVAMLAELRTSDGEAPDLTLTTNGSALRAFAKPLADAGLQRITVSLDSLDDTVFRRMNGVDFPVARVLDGIAAAQEAGLAPIKVNVGNANGWRVDDVVPAAEIVDLIGAEMPLEPAEPSYRGEVAERWRYVEGDGEIGLIASVTRPFCGDCTRARLSADGKLYTCLFSALGHDLRDPLRAGASDADLVDLIAGVWAGRDDRYSELRTASTSHLPKIEMFALGG